MKTKTIWLQKVLKLIFLCLEKQTEIASPPSFSCHADCNILQCGVLGQPLSSGGGKPNSTNSVTKLSSHIPCTRQGTMLRAGRSWVRVLMRWIFSN
jgi:hypothetical protein